MPRSEKPQLIEWVFHQRFNLTTKSLNNAVVTFDDINAAIAALRKQHLIHKLNPDANRANFWKDIIRKPDPNSYWPESVLAAGFTGDDAIGHGPRACFMFKPLPPGQTVAFTSPLSPSASAIANPILLESVSMPLATKALGRRDENWLAQVGVRLRVIESHFALRSKTQASEVTFLQTGVKLGQGEVDAAYSLINGFGTWLAAMEAKGKRERLHVPQVQRAAAELLRAAAGRSQRVVGVIPMAVKVLDPSKLHVVEFDPDTGPGSSGTVVVDSIIELRPLVTGVE